MARSAESSGVSGPPDPSLHPAEQRTLLSMPSPDTGSTVESTCTVEVRGLPTPDIGRSEPDAQESGTQALLRVFTPGVTLEHEGRYFRSDEAKSELGRGGIGRVFVALDRHLERQVAIKELLPAVMDAEGVEPLQAVSRFLREARVTSQLEHPNIVPVYEVGKRVDGTLYYTMRVVRGRTLARAISEAPSLRERLLLVNHFSGLCQAIAYAHSRGIVHRDIKPDNVMIGEFGETVVLDWGMAKVQGREAETSAPIVALGSGELTLEGSLCGTPLYMSPEQALGHVKDVDERSDVWSLGVVLYALLLGRLPFSGRTVIEIVEKVKQGRFEPLRVADPEIPPELAAVAERALRPSKAERYASAREIARDIEAYQAGARVAVYEYSSWELLKRFVARQRAAVIASAIGLGSVVGLGAAAYRRVVLERDRAVLAEQRAITNERSAKASEASAKQSLFEVLVEKAAQALGENGAIDAEILAANALVLNERADARGIALSAASILRPSPAGTVPELRGCSRLAFTFQFRIAACARDQSLELLRIDDKTRVWRRESLPGNVVGLAFGKTTPRFAVAFSGGTVELRDGQGALVLERRVAAPSSVAVAPDGNSLAVGTARGSAFVWDTRDLSERRFELGQAVSALAFSESGAELAAGGELGGLAVFDTIGSNPERRLPGHAGTLRGLSFSENGRHLASAGADRLVRFWDIDTKTALSAPIPHGDAVTGLAWSEDKRFLAFGGKDRSFTFVDLRGGVRKSVVRRFDDAVDWVQFSEDLRKLATFGKRDGFQLWDLPTSEPPSEVSDRGNVLALAVVGDGVLSAGLGQNGVCLWNVPLGECSTRLPVRLDRVRALAVSPDAESVAVAGAGERIFVWDLKNRVPRNVLEGLTDEARALAYSSDGRLLASGGLDKKLRIFDAKSGDLRRELPVAAAIQAIGFLGARGELVVGDREGKLSFWNAETGVASGALRAHDDWILSLGITADGRRLASAGADRQVRVWDVQRRERVFDLTGHQGKVLTVDFSRDGALLASAGEDKVIRIWDSRAGRELAIIPDLPSAVRAVRFWHDRPVLVSGGDDGTIRFWRLKGLHTPGSALLRGLEERFGTALSESYTQRR